MSDTSVKVVTVNFPAQEDSQIFSFQWGEEIKTGYHLTETVKNYLYEPNSALLKSGAFKLVSHRFSIEKLHIHSHLYTSNQKINPFPGRIFQVKQVVEFSRKKLRQLGKQYPQANISVRNFPMSAGHKTVKNLLATKAFTVSMATAGQMVACDYVGIVSGNKEPDKFAKAGFHATKSTFVNAPVIDELPMAVECELISYDPETCHLVGRIVNVSADESILDEQGKIDPAKLQPITFDPVHNAYLAIGGKVGDAFKAGLALKK